ncbi:Jerky-like, partial [Aphis craccivora]
IPKLLFPVGSPVNVTAIGYPYYAAIVVECDTNFVTVKYPLTNKLHKYNLKDVKPYTPQAKKPITKKKLRYSGHICVANKLVAEKKTLMNSAALKLKPMFVLYKSRHIWSTWTEGGPPSTRYSNSPSGWFDFASFLEWFESIFIPETRRLEGKKVVICDNVDFHFSSKVLELSETNNITFICLPPNSTHITQPLDVAVFRSVKGSWRKLLGEWEENNGNNLVTKEIKPTLLRRLLLEIDPTITNNLKSGFQACGIFPCDVEVLLKKIPGQTTDDSQ